MPTDHRTNSVRPAAAVKRPPLLGKSGGGCCLLQLDPHYSSSRYLPMMADEGTYVCKAFSPRSYVIQKVVVVLSVRSVPALCGGGCCYHSAQADQ